MSRRQHRAERPSVVLAKAFTGDCPFGGEHMTDPLLEWGASCRRCHKTWEWAPSNLGPVLVASYDLHTEWV